MWLVPGAVVWLLLASEISDEENAPALAQVLGVTAWSLLGVVIVGWSLLWLVKFAIRIGRRLIDLARARWAR